MSNFSAQDVKKIRDMTGAGMMDVKAALEKSKGDGKKAIELLRIKGQARASKKSDRETKNGLIGCYVHGGKIGVIVEVNCETDFVARTDEFKQFVHDLSMHIAATSPLYLTSKEIPKKELDKEKQVIEKELKEGSKPKEHLAKIVEGKLNTYYQQICLMDQLFVKDPKITIEKLIKEKIAKFGENITVSRFTRYELGESN